MTDLLNEDSPERIAIIAMTGRFPGADTVDVLWDNLCKGEESIVTFSDSELANAKVPDELLNNPDYVKKGVLLENIDLFDANYFGFTAREAEIIDPQHRLFLECSNEVLEMAGYESSLYDGSIGVYAGCSRNVYQSNVYSHAAVVKSAGWLQMELSAEKDFLATRVSHKLNLTGPSMSIQTACSTSLVAIHEACHSLLTYQCDMALAGGVSIKVPQVSGHLYQKSGIASPDGHCRPFDVNAQGTIRGSGTGVVLLKRLSEAVSEGDAILAVIRGSAINNDGADKVGYTAPSVKGQCEVIVAAREIADVSADSITYIETHGTGTPLGDPIEIQALKDASSSADSSIDTKNCVLGSIKSNIGHLDVAAGVTGLIKAVLCLNNKKIPPTLHFNDPNPEMKIEETSFYINKETISWQPHCNIRRAGVSSFGVGGTNAHIVLEENQFQQNNFKKSTRSHHLLILSAATKSALDKLSDDFLVFLQDASSMDIADAAFTLQQGRKKLRHRRAIICKDVEEAKNNLSNDGIRGLASVEKRSIVFMFPGQGSQYENMALGLYENEPFFKEQVEICTSILQSYLGLDLLDILYPCEPDTTFRINQTIYSQPALFVIEYAYAQLQIHYGIYPAAMIGHSVGEFVAACIAGVFSLEDALLLITERGRLLQAQEQGGMLSVAMSAEDIETLLPSDIFLAVDNGPELCVVSGSEKAIAEFQSVLNQNAIICTRLLTSHPFHSPYMSAAFPELLETVRKISLKKPKISFVSCYTGKWISDEEAMSPEYWANQIQITVRFKKGIQQLFEEDSKVFIEVGPGQVLTNLIKQQLPSKKNHAVLSSSRNVYQDRSDYAQWLELLGRAWTLGLDLSLFPLYSHEKRRRLSLPTYPFERSRYWLDMNDGLVEKGNELRKNQLKKHSDEMEWLYRPHWGSCISYPAFESGLLKKSKRLKFLVFHQQTPFDIDFIQALKDEGQIVTSVIVGNELSLCEESPYSINPENSSDFFMLAEHLSRVKEFPDRIVHLWMLTDKKQLKTNEDSDTFKVIQNLGFYSLLHIVQSFNSVGLTYPLSIKVVSNQMFDVYGDEEIKPEKATLLGAQLVISQEYPRFSCSYTDVDNLLHLKQQRSELVNLLLNEMVIDLPHSVTAVRRQQYWVREFQKIPKTYKTHRAIQLRENGVYLITGGLGNIGLTIAQYLANEINPRIILVSRRTIPDKSRWEEHIADEKSRWKEMLESLIKVQSLGAEVWVISADVSDQARMSNVVNDVTSQHGPINGIFHTAGSIKGVSFNSIQNLDVKNCEEQWQAKCRGVDVLAEVFDGYPLDFCILHSSLAAILGGLGYAAYSAANNYMDAFVHKQNKVCEYPWVSINWDGWKFATTEGLSLESNSLGEEILQASMTPTEGIKVLKRVFELETIQQVIVSTSELSHRIKHWVTSFPDAQSSSEQGDATLPNHPRPELADDYSEPETEIEKIIALIWKDLLGLEQVGRHDNFMELGGHSLLAMHVITEISSYLKIDIPLRTFFQALTVSKLALVAESMITK